jgi:hypothetical protein
MKPIDYGFPEGDVAQKLLPITRQKEYEKNPMTMCLLGKTLTICHAILRKEIHETD